MFRPNENTLSFFQDNPVTNKHNKYNEEKEINKYIITIKEDGYAYCWNERICKILKSRGYKVSSNGMVEK